MLSEGHPAITEAWNVWHSTEPNDRKYYSKFQSKVGLKLKPNGAQKQLRIVLLQNSAGISSYPHALTSCVKRSSFLCRFWKIANNKGS